MCIVVCIVTLGYDTRLILSFLKASFYEGQGPKPSTSPQPHVGTAVSSFPPVSFGVPALLAHPCYSSPLPNLYCVLCCCRKSGSAERTLRGRERRLDGLSCAGRQRRRGGPGLPGGGSFRVVHVRGGVHQGVGQCLCMLLRVSVSLRAWAGTPLMCAWVPWCRAV